MHFYLLMPSFDMHKFRGLTLFQKEVAMVLCVFKLSDIFHEDRLTINRYEQTNTDILAE